MDIRTSKYLTLLFANILFQCNSVKSQDTLRVLFLGNSYTSVNNLPQLVKNMAAAANTVMITDQNVPGGYTIESHVANTISLSKIRAGRWDYVVLQEQSQIPTIDQYRYNSMYPSLLQIKDSILLYNPCGKIITYMTWGRRFGGQQCDGTGTYCSPTFRDFNHMQDSLRSAYMQISDSLKVQCAPVGISWQQVLNDTALVLHQGDNSHPNLYGSYLAACTIYSTITKKGCLGLSYTGGLSAPLATYLQMKADETVFSGDDDWNLFIYQPRADFSYRADRNIVSFFNESTNNTNVSLTYQWHFGDGDSTFNIEPIHTYNQPGSYQVSLIASGCSLSDTLKKTIVIPPAPDSNGSEYTIYPNPATDLITIAWKSDVPHSISIYNSLGQKMVDQSLNSNEKQVRTNRLANGCYFIRICGATQSQILRLQIVR